MGYSKPHSNEIKLKLYHYHKIYREVNDMNKRLRGVYLHCEGCYRIICKADIYKHRCNGIPIYERMWSYNSINKRLEGIN